MLENIFMVYLVLGGIYGIFVSNVFCGRRYLASLRESWELGGGNVAVLELMPNWRTLLWNVVSATSLRALLTRSHRCHMYLRLFCFTTKNFWNSFKRFGKTLKILQCSTY